MNTRNVATEAASLAAASIAVYAAGALLVGALGESITLSFGAVLAVVALSYALARLLQNFDISDEALRWWGLGLSIGLLYVILRIDIAHDAYLWQVGWVGDLLTHPGRTLEGRSGDVAEVLLLAGVWAWGVQRASRRLTFEAVLGEAGLGLAVVAAVAILAPSADLEGHLQWLPLPYLAVALVALALMHMAAVQGTDSLRFLRSWAVWTGGLLVAMAAIAWLGGFLDPSLERLSGAFVLAGKGIGLAIFYALAPFIAAVAWVMEGLVGLIPEPEPFIPDEQQDAMDLVERDEQEERSLPRWAVILRTVLGFGAVGVLALIALALLWLAFRRIVRREGGDEEVREDVEPEAVAPAGGLQALAAAMLGRLRGRRSRVGARDAIGRLYVGMLERASAEGASRSPGTTPLEFAPRLDEHFGSEVPGHISRAYAEARYGDRHRTETEVAKLRAWWEEALATREG
ncbi:MAG: DUF4129 domain-containing protein [Chloroflexota bacterium]